MGMTRRVAESSNGTAPAGRRADGPHVPLELTALGDGWAQLPFSHHDAVELGMAISRACNFNWGSSLEGLRLLCTTSTGKPFVA